VRPFSAELGIAENVPIVDGAIVYESPFTGEAFVLLIGNELHIPSMNINLVPPFIMRAGGVIVNDTLKIHCNEPTVDDHCISFINHDLRIPMQLWGTFSYFHSRIPTAEELDGCDKIFITPDSTVWNPHCESFAKNEQSMLDFEGNTIDSRRRTNHIMEREPEDYSGDYELNAVTADAWNEAVDLTTDDAFKADSYSTDDCPDPCISEFAAALSLRGEISKLCGSIGSCTISAPECDVLFENPSSIDLDELDG